MNEDCIGCLHYKDCLLNDEDEVEHGCPSHVHFESITGCTEKPDCVSVCETCPIGREFGRDGAQAFATGFEVKEKSK